MKNLFKVTAAVLFSIAFTSCSTDDLDEINAEQSRNYDMFEDRLKSGESNDAGTITILSATVSKTSNPASSIEPFTFTYDIRVDLSGLNGPFEQIKSIGDVMLLNQENDLAPIGKDGLLVQRDQLSASDTDNASYRYNFGSTQGDTNQWKFLKVVVDNLNGERTSIKVPVTEI